MKHTPHEPKLSERRRPSAWASSARRLLGVVVVVVGGAGCDIVQGFQDAGDSLFPEQSSHLGSPGVRIASGHYNRLGLTVGTEVYLLAREADDDTGKLFSMRYAEPQPCVIPKVGHFGTTREATRSAPLISYFEEDVRRGTLHFADATCKTFPLSFEDARLPVAETEHSLVVWAGEQLWLATPEVGTQEELADGVTDVIRSVVGRRFAVRANGQLTIFDAAWKEHGTFGEEVGAVLRAGQSLFYTDKLGAHRIVESQSSPEGVEDELLIEDACSIASQDGTWVALRSPCSDGPLRVIHEPSGRIFTLPFDADPAQLQLVPARNSPGRDPLSDPFWFFYLRNGEAEGSENTLFVRTPAGAEHALGAHGTLQQLRLLESDDETHGYALIDADGSTGRYIWWNPDGETRVLAENTMARPNRLIVDFDGTEGKVAVTSGDRLVVVAEHVPWQAFEYQDSTKKWTVLFHDMQAGVGRLSTFPAGLDALDAVPADAPFTAPELTEVASDVVALGTSSLDEVLSGVIYLTRFDATTLTGHLEYRNLELRFTADVNDGVSDYIVSHDEVLYAVPYGSEAGIWLVAGK